MFLRLLAILFPLFSFVKTANASMTPLSAKDIHATQTLSFEELERFSKDWTQYTIWLKKQSSESNVVAHMSVNPTADYSKASRKWIEKNNWTVDRFFYIEKIIRESLNYLSALQKYEAFITQIDAQVDTLRKSDIPNKEEIIAHLMKSVERKEEYIPPVQPVSDDELALIKANFNSLSELMRR